MCYQAENTLVSPLNLFVLKGSGKRNKRRKENESKRVLENSLEFQRPDCNLTAKDVMLQRSTFQFPQQTYLFIFSSFLCCRTHSLDIFSFSNNIVFLLVHRNSLLLGSQSELSKFSKLLWSPFNG